MGLCGMRHLRKSKFGILAIAAACFLLLVGYKEQTIRVHYTKDMVSVAHRGASHFAPENSRAAFQKSVELNADFLECDVHVSKDGELIIMHDDKIDRTTNGSGFIKEFTLDELKQLDAGASFSKEFKGEQILTLNELIDEFYDQIGLLIELKNPKLYPGIEEKIASLLGEYDDLSSIIVQSFDIDSMKKMSVLLPNLQVAVLIHPKDSLLSAAKLDDLASFASYINFNVSFLNKKTVERVHDRGAKVFVWSKKDKNIIAKAHKYNVDGIITDFSNWPYEELIYLAQE